MTELSMQTPERRLREIAEIIEANDNRYQAGDGPVTMDAAEISQIHELAIGRQNLEPICPHCDAPLSESTYVENIRCGRIIDGFNEGVLSVQSSYSTDGLDVSDDAGYLICGKCLFNITIPDGVDVVFV